jgi:hypothetical protein
MTRNSRTDPETGLRFYRWLDKEYPSVTTIRRLIGMPFNLHQWSLTQVIDRALDQHDEMHVMLERPRKLRERVLAKNVRQEVATWLRKAATEERDRKGVLGTAVHDAIDQGVTPDQTAGSEIHPYLAQYMDFLETTGAKVLLREEQVFNLKYGYAGTLDALIYLPPTTEHPLGRSLVVDYKTSNSVYLDHVIQCVAYGMGDFVGRDDRVIVPATQALQQAEGLAILHLLPNGWELIEVKPDPDIFRAFLGSLDFARVINQHPYGIDALVVQRQHGGTLVPQLQASLNALAASNPPPPIPTITP